LFFPKNLNPHFSVSDALLFKKTEKSSDLHNKNNMRPHLQHTVLLLAVELAITIHPTISLQQVLLCPGVYYFPTGTRLQRSQWHRSCLRAVVPQDDGFNTPNPKAPPLPKKKRCPSPTGFSHVEEGVYASDVEEIEAMGGDPFFLVSSDDCNIPVDALTKIKDIGSDTNAEQPTWEWDGVEEDTAYFD
jgi:hypothetical protein